MHYPLQGSSHQVWSAQVHSSLGTRLVQEAQYSYRVWGHAPQEWNLETMRLRLRPFWAHTMLLRGQMTEFHMYVIYTLSAHCVLQYWFRPSNRPLKFLEEKLIRVFLHYLQPSLKFQHVTCVLGGLTWASTG